MRTFSRKINYLAIMLKLVFKLLPSWNHLSERANLNNSQKGQLLSRESRPKRKERLLPGLTWIRRKRSSGKFRRRTMK